MGFRVRRWPHRYRQRNIENCIIASPAPKFARNTLPAPKEIKDAARRILDKWHAEALEKSNSTDAFGAALFVSY
jgi:hypothetical protein